MVLAHRVSRRRFATISSGLLSTSGGVPCRESLRVVPRGVAPHLDPYPVQMEHTVQWGDMNAACHVSHIAFLSYCEHVRVRYFAAIGAPFSYEAVQPHVGRGDGASVIMPVCGSISCSYFKPLTFPATLVLGVRVVEVQGPKMLMECGIVARSPEMPVEQAPLVASAVGKCVAYDFTLSKTAETMPAQWMSNIERLEGWDPDKRSSE